MEKEGYNIKIDLRKKKMNLGKTNISLEDSLINASKSKDPTTHNNVLTLEYQAQASEDKALEVTEREIDKFYPLQVQGSFPKDIEVYSSPLESKGKYIPTLSLVGSIKYYIRR